jgi:hypothetical protein
MLTKPDLTSVPGEVMTSETAEHIDRLPKDSHANKFSTHRLHTICTANVSNYDFVISLIFPATK